MTQSCDFGAMDCPEPENYAAVAKQLHETAVQAEERIYCMEKLLRYSVNRETYVATTNGDMGPYGSSSGIVDNFWTILTTSHVLTVNFANFPVGSMRQANGWILPTGMWHIGFYGATFSFGAANDNTYRQLRILKVRTNPLTGGVTATSEISHTNWESANGVQILMNASGVFRIEQDERIVFGFRHGNTSSGVAFAAGAIVWMTRLSDADLIRVI